METIRTRAIEAQELIQGCIDEFGPRSWAQQGCELHIAFKDLRGRFRSWCGHVGISQPGDASLQPYIREEDRLQKSVLSFIRTLSLNLTCCQATLSNEDQASAGSDDKPKEYDEESDEDTEAVSREDQIGARLLSMKHTLNSLYELSFLIHKYKSAESALPRPELLQRNDKAKDTEQSQPQGLKQQPRPTQHSAPHSSLVQNTTEGPEQVRQSPGRDDVSGHSERFMPPIRVHVESPHQDLEPREQSPLLSDSRYPPPLQNPLHPPYRFQGPASSGYVGNILGQFQGASDDGGGTMISQLQPNVTMGGIVFGGPRLARPANISREFLQRAAYDGPLPILPGFQPEHVPNTQNLQLDRGRGQHPGPSQIQPRPQPGLSSMSQLTQSMASTNLAPGASNSAASSVQTRRFQQNGAVLQQSIDPNTGVQVILQNTPPTPRNLQAEGIVLQRSLVGTTGNAERLFPEYTVRPSRFFCLGRVFLVLWAEPAGGSGSNAGTVLTMQEQGTVLNHLGERVFSKVRRFVVIRESDQYCNALPITTYSGRGVAKRNVVKSEHAIIYTGRDLPQPRPDERPLRGETGMRSQSIRVDPDNRTDRLDEMSRIHFGGVHQVHHNIKTKSLGIVNRNSIDALQSQFANVCQDQLRSRSRAGAGRSQAQGTQRMTAVAGAGGVVGAGVVASTTADAPADGSDDDDEDEDGEEPSSEEDASDDE